MENYKIEVKFEVTPLGKINATWIIPNVLLSEVNEFRISIPGFKYDLPSFASIPVPFSSKSVELQTSDINFSNPIGQVSEKQSLYSDKELLFKLERIQDLGSNTTIKYSILNIVNNDGIYFVLVYPFRSPFQGIEHIIELKAKLSYNLRKFRFWERYFTFPSNAKLNINKVFTSIKDGDEIIVKGIYTPTNDRTLDLHLTATRFPILIRRDKFWMTIFIILTLITLSPYIVLLIDKLTK